MGRASIRDKDGQSPVVSSRSDRTIGMSLVRILGPVGRLEPQAAGNVLLGSCGRCSVIVSRFRLG